MFNLDIFSNMLVVAVVVVFGIDLVLSVKKIPRRKYRIAGRDTLHFSRRMYYKKVLMTMINSRMAKTMVVLTAIVGTAELLFEGETEAPTIEYQIVEVIEFTEQTTEPWEVVETENKETHNIIVPQNINNQ